LIFVTTGSMFPFDRLVHAVDAWVADRGYDEVLVQIGHGLAPSKAQWVRMLRPAEFAAAIARSELVVAHLGMGSIMAALQAKKPIILFPRRLALREHTSDHQAHAEEWVRTLSGAWVAHDVSDLHGLLDKFLKGELLPPPAAISLHAPPELLANVAAFVRAERHTK
jgi:UDP-N-acetylglucosamine transferase subunit ALG13